MTVTKASNVGSSVAESDFRELNGVESQVGQPATFERSPEGLPRIILPTKTAIRGRQRILDLKSRFGVDSSVRSTNFGTRCISVHQIIERSIVRSQAKHGAGAVWHSYERSQRDEALHHGIKRSKVPQSLRRRAVRQSRSVLRFCELRGQRRCYSRSAHIGQKPVNEQKSRPYRSMCCVLCMLCLMMGSKPAGRLQSGSNAPHSNYVLPTQEVRHVAICSGESA